MQKLFDFLVYVFLIVFFLMAVIYVTSETVRLLGV